MSLIIYRKISTFFQHSVNSVKLTVRVRLTFAEEMRLNPEEQKKAQRRSRERPRHTEMLHLSEDMTRSQQHIHPNSTRNKHSLILRKNRLMGKDTFHAEKPMLVRVELLARQVSIRRD